MTAEVFPAPLTFSEPPERVLVVVTRRIGDVLLATPVIRSLKAHWPHAQLDVLVFAGTSGFLHGNSDVRSVLSIPERPTFAEHLRFVTGLLRRYDLALSLLPGDRPTLYAWLAGRKRVGLQLTDDKSRFKRRLLHAWVAFDPLETHTVRMHLALLKALDIRPAADVLPAWTQADESQVHEILRTPENRPYAVLHPFPKFRYKMWTSEGWVALGRWLVAHGYRVVITGGPERAEREYNAEITRSIEGAQDLTGQLTLGGVSVVVRDAAAYIGTDTAITHAAAATGTPTVALFGPTNAVKWGPWPHRQDATVNPWIMQGSQSQHNVRLVQGAGACVPCGFEGCERHIESTSACLTGLSADRVIAAVQDLISAEDSV